MKHSLQLKLSQHLTLTPQLQQSIRLLQLSTLELNQELERFLQENPLLEREEEDGEEGAPPATPTAEAAPEPPPDLPSEIPSDIPSEISTSSASEGDGDEVPDAPEAAESTERESMDDADWLDEGSYGNSGSPEGEESDYPQMPAGTTSLREHLLWQVNLMNLPHRDKQMAAIIVDSLDDNGYMKQDLAELAEMLPAEIEADEEDLLIALRHVQNLDPPGVAARDLGECLALQLEALPQDTPWRTEALNVVRQQLDALAGRDYAKLKKALKCDDNALREVQRLITGLNPRPGARFSTEEPRYVVSDVIVRKLKGMWVASLNPDAMPKLRINRMYADILSRNRDASHQQLAGQLQEAKWLIKNVQQRFDTILRVSQCIVDRQRHFFEHGEVAMRPLVLREIAEILGLHESTVSRVTTQKFMFTPRGIFELKYFFGSHVTTETGGACSATAIRALIKQLVGEEDTKRPLSDSQISEILGKQGIVVARRTIAKYRESLQILPVNLRKSI
ncbi:MAG: RNA polymerase factor sigma-54 [Burkholderiales bacterium]|jgi:RNA polymerase sigma-54 factor|nr:RNA polymerase factor sigma-54 [Burkholderiales bacterium]